MIVFAVFAGWALPFLLLSWHGGLGSNMRYLLPTLPALCAVAGWLILGLVRRAGGWRPLAAGGLVAAVAAFAWLDLVPGRSAQLHQIVSIYALLGVAGLSLAAGIFARLLHRDGKQGYLADIPRTLGYVVDVGTRYPETAGLARLVRGKVLPALAA